jgi:hypothetical protein
MEAEVQELKHTTYCNLALVDIKLENYEKAVTRATKALEIA